MNGMQFLEGEDTPHTTNHTGNAWSPSIFWSHTNLALVKVEGQTICLTQSEGRSRVKMSPMGPLMRDSKATDPVSFGTPSPRSTHRHDDDDDVHKLASEALRFEPLLKLSTFFMSIARL